MQAPSSQMIVEDFCRVWDSGVVLVFSYVSVFSFGSVSAVSVSVNCCPFVSCELCALMVELISSGLCLLVGTGLCQCFLWIII
jgi:hypothetical protein